MSNNLFARFEPVALKVARCWVNLQNHDLGDLEQIARLTLLEVLPRIDPNNPRADSFVGSAVRNRMRRLWRDSDPYVGVDSLDDPLTPGKTTAR